MRKQNVPFGVALLVMALAFSGCGGNFPAMTEEDEEAVGEYAAHLLLKYDANHRSRLVDLAEVEAWEAEEQKRKEEQKEKENFQEPGGMDPVDDTPIVDITEDISSGVTVDNTINSLEQFWEVPEEVQIIYTGYDVSDSLTSDFFTVDALEGKKLLLLHFQINNQSSSDQTVDLLSQNANIKVTVNGSYTRNTLTTMLMEDLSTYRDSIPAGESVETLLVVEIEREMADQISSISLNLKNESKIYTIQLI